MNSTHLAGRVALVTGASRGIGRAIAVALADVGADVAVNYASNDAAAEVTAEAVRATGRRVSLHRADVGDPATLEQMVADVEAAIGTVDLLVNNAGVGAQSIGYPTIAEADPTDIARVLDVNFWGALHLCRLLAPGMRDRPRGDVIMISSGAARSARPRMGAYTISKAAMEALGHTLAVEERPYGTRVNIVEPGLVETDMGVGAMRQFLGTDDPEGVAADMPFGMICQPEDIANTVVFLCSDRGRYITNQTIVVNGGGQ